MSCLFSGAFQGVFPQLYRKGLCPARALLAIIVDFIPALILADNCC